MLTQSGHAIDAAIEWRGATIGLMVTASDDFVGVGGGGGDSYESPLLAASELDAAAAVVRRGGGRLAPGAADFVAPRLLSYQALPVLPVIDGQAPAYTLRGKAAVRRRQLAAIDGLPIVTINFWEWRNAVNMRSKTSHEHCN